MTFAGIRTPAKKGACSNRALISVYRESQKGHVISWNDIKDIVFALRIVRVIQFVFTACTYILKRRGDYA